MRLEWRDYLVTTLSTREVVLGYLDALVVTKNHSDVPTSVPILSGLFVAFRHEIFFEAF